MGVQVRTATFGREGKPLPIIERQFISFSWGGKNIEDFDLIVVNSGDRMSKDLYAPFEDATTNYTYVDGQTYWGTTIRANTLDFTLATDGMDSKTMEEFKKWFCPGEARPLILSEFPFRYAMARVSAPPKMEMLAFEKKIHGTYGTFRTTEYKGEINLTLVMDDPYWYNTEDASYFVGDLSEEQLKDNYETGTPCFTQAKNMKIEDFSIFPRNYLSSREIAIDGNTIVFDGSTSSSDYVSTVYIGLCDAKSVHHANFSQKIQGQVLPTDLVTVKYVNKSTTSISTTTMTVLEALEKINSGEISGDISWGTFTERLVLYDKQPDGSINRSKVKNIGYLNSRGDIAASGVMSKAIYIDSEGYATVKDNQTATLDFTYTSGVQDDIDYFEKYSTFGIRLAYSVPSGKTYDYLMILNSIRMTVDLELSNFSDIVYPPDASGWYANNKQIGTDRMVHYYGTAPALPITTFTLKSYLIDSKNYLASFNATDYKNLFQLKLGEEIFTMTLPPYLAAYNTAIEVVRDAETGTSITDIEDELRAKVTSSVMRTQVLQVFYEWRKTIGLSLPENRENFYALLKNQNNIDRMIIKIDSKSGLIKVQYLSTDAIILEETAGSCIKSALPVILPTENHLVDITSSETLVDFKIDYNYRFY